MNKTEIVEGKAIIYFDKFKIGTQTFKSINEWVEKANPKQLRSYLVTITDIENVKFQVATDDIALNLKEKTYTIDANEYRKEQALFKKANSVLENLKLLHESGIEMSFCFIDKYGEYFKNESTDNINIAR